MVSLCSNSSCPITYSNRHFRTITVALLCTEFRNNSRNRFAPILCWWFRGSGLKSSYVHWALFAFCSSPVNHTNHSSFTNIANYFSYHHLWKRRSFRRCHRNLYGVAKCGVAQKTKGKNVSRKFSFPIYWQETAGISNRLQNEHFKS